MKIQIVSGFLGSGKTTFLNRYLTCLQGSVAVIENEFGQDWMHSFWGKKYR